MKRLLLALAGTALLMGGSGTFAPDASAQPSKPVKPATKPVKPAPTARRAAADRIAVPAKTGQSPLQIRQRLGRRQAGQPRAGQAGARRIQPSRRAPQAGINPAKRRIRLGAPGAAKPSDSHAGHAHAKGAHGKVAGVAGARGTKGAAAAKDTRALGNSKAMALLFWLFAFAIVAGAIFVITRRNLVVAVMGMVGTFFAIAAVFAMLYAHFLAVIQVMVYAGAIMVLFVFVVMILNRPEDEPYGKKNWIGRGLALVGAGYLLLRIGTVLWTYRPINAAAGAAPGKSIDGFDFGSTEAVGTTLFGEYLFPFEAVSLVLLIAVVGAIAVARPHIKRETLGAGSASPALDAAE